MFTNSCFILMKKLVTFTVVFKNEIPYTDKFFQMCYVKHVD